MWVSAFVWTPLKKTLLSTGNKSAAQLLRSHTDGGVVGDPQHCQIPLITSGKVTERVLRPSNNFRGGSCGYDVFLSVLSLHFFHLL